MILPSIISKVGVGLSARILPSWTVLSLDSTMACWEVFHRRYCTPAGGAGPGPGKSGPAGGSSREGGGDMGRFGSIHEEGYFLTKEKEQLSKLKKQLKENPDLVLKKKDDK